MALTALVLCDAFGLFTRYSYTVSPSINEEAISLPADYESHGSQRWGPKSMASASQRLEGAKATSRRADIWTSEEAPKPAACKAGDGLMRKITQMREENTFPEELIAPWPNNVPTAMFKLLSTSVKRKVAASIAVHPPKYYALIMFLAEWLRCPAAYKAMNIYVVFQYKEDLDLFREAVDCIIPGTPELWVPVVANAPKKGWPKAYSMGNQYIAAYKKYYGLAAMMDIGKEEYGLMMDSEIGIYAMRAEASSDEACGADGTWSKLLNRIQAFERRKVWPGARVSPTLTTYDFGSFKKSGRDYDLHLLRENARYLVEKGRCQPEQPCQKVENQLKKVIWTWWTELPIVRLEVAKRMMVQLSRQSGPGPISWRAVTQNIFFPRFEHVVYQMWCMLYEGWDIQDVTNITLEAKWGSYLEDPQENSELAKLQPMWVSSEALSKAQSGKIMALSKEEPPLILFHVDMLDLRYSAGGHDYKVLWEDLVLALLKLHNRTDYSEENIH